MMTTRTTRRRPSVRSVIMLALALLIFGLSVIAVVLWTPIDESFINRADQAGDISLLLPHQTGLWLVINAQTIAAFLISVFAFVTMWKSRTERSDLQSGRGASNQLRLPTQEHESADP